MQARRAACLIVAVSAALILASAVAGSARADAIPTPDGDPFYQAPSGLAGASPGTVLRSRAVTVTGLGVPIPAQAWQVLYRSGDSRAAPIADVATIIVPLAPYPGKRPLVSYQMAIDSLGAQCNPSYEMRTGTEKEMAAIGPLIEAGWAVVVPDFEGPRNAYTAGLLAAHVVLDGIRAALRFAPAGLGASDTPLGLWGYSGGGQATAWATEQQPGYAPELKVAGVAEGGVPPDIEQVARQIDGGPFFGIYFAASVGLSREYPELDLDSLLNDKGKALKAQIGTQCAETLVTGYPNQHMSDYTTVPDVLAVARVRRVVEADRLGQATPSAPLYIYHSVLDELIPVAGPDALVAKYCSAGATVFYQRDVAGDHIAYAFTGAPAAIAYLSARFEGLPALANCTGHARRGAGSPSGSPAGGRAQRPRHPRGASPCPAGRRLSFGLRRVRGARVTRAVVYVNGHRLLARRGRDIRRVSFVRPAGRRLTIKIVTTNNHGGRVLTTRTYRGCKRGRVTGRVRHRRSGHR